MDPMTVHFWMNEEKRRKCSSLIYDAYCFASFGIEKVLPFLCYNLLCASSAFLSFWFFLPFPFYHKVSHRTLVRQATMIGSVSQRHAHRRYRRCYVQSYYYTIWKVGAPYIRPLCCSSFVCLVRHVYHAHGPHRCSISLLQRGPLLSIFVCKVTTVRKNLIKPNDCFKFSCWYLILSHTISFHPNLMFLMYPAGIFHMFIIYVSRVSTKYRE